jgi:phage major head subunit gpT-like protein
MMPSFGKFTDFTNLALALRAIWERELIIDSAVAQFFSIQASQRAAERTQELGNFGLVPEYNGSIEYDEVEPGDRMTFIHKEFAKGLKLPRRLIDDEEYGAVNRMLSNHALAFSRTVTYHMSSVFNNAFSSSFPVADGSALCATGRDSGKAVLSNKGTDALTHDAVVDTRAAMRQFKDRNGLVLQVRPNALVVPIDLESTAFEITQSVNRSDNAENASNFNRQMRYVVDPLLEDANDWFLVDSEKARMHLMWFWRVQPELQVHPASQYDLELRTRGYMRYSFGADDFVWIYGHEVSD